MSEFVMGASVHLDNNFSATMSAMTSDTERFKATADSANTSVSNLDKSLNGLRTDAFKSVSGTATEAAKSANQAADATNRIVAPMNNVVTSTNRAQNAIQSFNRGWEKVKSLPGTLKNVGTTLKSNVVNGLTSARLQASVLTASIKTLGAQKLNGLVSSVKQFKSTITEGKTGVTGFTNALKNLGKISVAGAVNSVGKLGAKLKSLIPDFKSSENGSNSLLAALKKVASVSMSALHSGISKIGSLAKTAGSAVAHGLGTAAKIGTGALIAGTGAAIAGINNCMSVLGEQTAMETQLATTAKNMGIPDEAVQSIKSYASELQGITMYGDEAMIGAAAEAATYFTDPEAIKSLMGTVTDYAAGMSGGTALSTQEIVDYTTNLAKMTTGAYDAMTKKGFEVTDMQKKILETGTDMEKVAVINDIISESWGGMAQSFVETPTGKLAQMNNLFGDLKEKIGAIFSDKYVAVLGVFTDALKGLNDILEDGFQTEDLTKMTGILDDVVSKGAQAVSKYLPTIMNFVSSALVTIGNSLIQMLPSVVSALSQGLVTMFNGLLTVLEQTGPQIILTIMNSLNNAVIALLGMLPQFVNVASQIIIAIIQGLAAAAPTLIPAIVQAILGMINSIVQNIPMFIQAGLQLIMGLVQGIFNAIPILVQMAPVIVQNLVSGLTAMLPQIIQTGIQMIVSIIQGIIQNLPQILQAAVQIVVTLAVGLIQAIPQLIAAVPQLVSAIIDTILSTNWLDVGWQIVSGIGKGLWDGIKGIFGGGGEEGGAAVSQGAATGITSNLGTVTGATTQLSQTMTQGLQPDVATANMMGVQTVTAITDGMNSVDMSATATTVGTGITDGVVTGIDTGSANVVAAATGMTDQASAAITAGMSNITTAVNDFDISGFEASCDGMINAITEGVTICEQTVSTGMQNIISIVSSVDLYSSGVNIMQGLNNGMLSMQGAITATAQSIANSVKSTINSALQIHSPSRVLEESGEYTGEGFANGLMNLIDRVRANAQALADTTVKPFSVSSNSDDIAVSGRYDTGRSGETRSGLSVMIDKLILQDVGNKDPKQLVKEIISELATQMGDTDELLSDIGMGVLL